MGEGFRTLFATVAVFLATMTVMSVPPVDAAPMFSMSMDILPEDAELFPTYAQTGRIEFLGTIHCNKTRPDEVRVQIEGTCSEDWGLSIEPALVIFRHVGERHQQFHIYLPVPPRTAGPPLVTVDVRAFATFAGRTEECTGQARLHIIQDTGAFLEGFPEKIVVPPDGGVDGTAFVENVLDEPLELHICALGEWEGRIRGLDFQQEVVLRPYEQRPARFHGTLGPGVEAGVHHVEMALWTPSEDGGRSYITTMNVTLDVLEDTGETLGFALMRSAVPILIVACAAVGAATFWTLRRRERAKGQGP